MLTVLILRVNQQIQVCFVSHFRFLFYFYATLFVQGLGSALLLDYEDVLVTSTTEEGSHADALPDDADADDKPGISDGLPCHQLCASRDTCCRMEHD